MGLFDDAVPGGSIAKPLMIALGALLVGKMMGGGSQPEPAQPSQSPQAGAGGLGGILGGGLAGGLGSLLERFNSSGQGNVANSWVGTTEPTDRTPTGGIRSWPNHCVRPGASIGHERTGSAGPALPRAAGCRGQAYPWRTRSGPGGNRAALPVLIARVMIG
jgi:hypothetical protein